LLGEGNTIMGNGTGVMVLEVDAGFAGTYPAENNSILGNAIDDNIGLGIDLGRILVNPFTQQETLDGLGVTPNDVGDGDMGANGLQNFPVLASATLANDMLVVEGTLNSMPSEKYYVEFFASAGGSDIEGKTFLGGQVVTTDMNGDAPLFFDVPLMVTPVEPGQVITATATAVNYDPQTVTYDYFGTSEFSGGVVANAPANMVMSEIMYDPASAEPGW
jgi:hypothetical protein